MRRATGCPLCYAPTNLRDAADLDGTSVCARCHRAYFLRRVAAFHIDLIVFGALSLGLCTVLGPSLDLSRTTSEVIAFVLIQPLLALRDSIQGVSPGKLLTGLQAIDKRMHAPVGPGGSLRRNWPYLLPGVWPVLANMFAFEVFYHGRRTWERESHTRVIWLAHAHQPPFSMHETECPHCGYDLTGNISGRCPECGQRIPPRIQRRLESPELP